MHTQHAHVPSPETHIPSHKFLGYSYNHKRLQVIIGRVGRRIHCSETDFLPSDWMGPEGYSWTGRRKTKEVMLWDGVAGLRLDSLS